MNARKLLSAAKAVEAAYIEDVFSTYLYDGNGSTQTITNGIDLAGKGGMVWIKKRSTPIANNCLFDTSRGALSTLFSDATNAATSLANTLTAFNSNGFTLGSESTVNGSGHPTVAWTFREAPKFFDVVTYTGNGSAYRTISHNLGSVPGTVIAKRTDSAGDWFVWHRSLGKDAGNSNGVYNTLQLNTTAAAFSTVVWGDTRPSVIPDFTSTQFSVGGVLNTNGGTYVAYLFAHDAGGFGQSGSDNVISCGSFTSNVSGNASVTLGYEPQWLLYKPSTGADNWYIVDSMRGFLAPGTTGMPVLSPNLSSAEQTITTRPGATATGFSVGVSLGNTTYIYIAIRRGPMKTPTTGTQVFQPTVYTGTNVDNRLVNTTIAPDMVWVRQRDSTTVAGMVVGDRLRGQPYSLTGSTATEVNTADAFDQQIVSATEYGGAFSAMNGFWCGNDPTASLNANTTSNNQIAEAFKRAPGFFDVVCYTGTGSGSLTLSHNLTVAPEIIITKARNDAASWQVYWNQQRANLNTNSAFVAATYTASTATQFTVLSFSNTAHNYVAYLFASLPGISKVGSYTGNGSNQTINCGFSAGARFVLIRRTDSTGNWYVFDTARGIVTGNDPLLLLDSTNAEDINRDTVDPDNSGFVVNQLAATNINVNSATYLFLAIA